MKLTRSRAVVGTAAVAGLGLLGTIVPGGACPFKLPGRPDVTSGVTVTRAARQAASRPAQAARAGRDPSPGA